MMCIFLGFRFQCSDISDSAVFDDVHFIIDSGFNVQTSTTLFMFNCITFFEEKTFPGMLIIETIFEEFLLSSVQE